MWSIKIIETILAANNDGVIVAEYSDDAHSIIFCNAAFLKLTGYSETEVLGKDVCFPLSNNCERLKQALVGGGEYTDKLQVAHKDGRVFWSQTHLSYVRQNNEITHVIAFYKDITQEEYLKSVLDKVNILYREMSKRLEYTSETDHLTQLKNRGHLCTRGEFMLGAAKREKLRLHAIVVDIDNFKLLNESGGQKFGDECLIRVAEVIKRYFSRATDIAIRMGNDDFVVLCIEDDDRRVWQRVEALRGDVRSIRMQSQTGQAYELSVSAGIFSITPEKHTTIEEIVQSAGQLTFRFGRDVRDQITHTTHGDQHRSLRH